MNIETSKDIVNCPNSKTEIVADNYNKTRVFNVNNDPNQRFSRVDSQNYPDATGILDSLAHKMRFNHQSNKSTPARIDNNILDRHIEEKSSEKGLSKSFQISPDKPLKETSNKTNHKKSGFMSNLIRRLSISTPKVFSKNKKQKKAKVNGDIDSHENKNQENKTNEPVCQDKLINGDKLTNGLDENHVQSTPKSRSIRKILHKLGKKKGRSNITSEPPSSIDSRPSLSSVANNGVNMESAISCHDIFIDKLCKQELQKYNSSSADCILDFQNHVKSINHRQSGSSSSEDHEAKLNAVDNVGQNVSFNNEFPDLELPVSQTDTDDMPHFLTKKNDFKFDTQKSCHSTMSASYQAETSHNVKLTLALYGYCNYGLSSSRLTSKSCMEFRAATLNQKIKLSAEDIPRKQQTKSNANVGIENLRTEEESRVNIEKVEDAQIDIVDARDKDDNKCDSQEKGEGGKEEDESVILRRSKRPIDIKLRKSREPNPNLVARSSMIMLVVSHNSPRSKIISNQLSTPTKDFDLNSSLNGSSNLPSNIPAMKLTFDGLSINDTETVPDLINRQSERLSASFDGNKMKNVVKNGFTGENTEVLDGHHFLNMVHKYENEILMKIDIVQNYINNKENVFDEEVSGQLMVTVGKAKLLLSEKMLQFKGLCEKNISGIIEENELPTLVSDLNGFWDMVYGQIEDINKNFLLVEKIRLNDWKMIPFETERRGSLNTPARSKLSTNQIRKSSVNNISSTPKKKNVSADPSAKFKISAEKRKNMMLFKMNQKASMAPKPDSEFSEDITFY